MNKPLNLSDSVSSRASFFYRCSSFKDRRSWDIHDALSLMMMMMSRGRLE